MKIKKLFVPFIVILAALTGLTINAQPGDSNDPLVSKSYVDARIDEALQILGAGGAYTSSAGQATVDVLDMKKQIIDELLLVLDNTSKTAAGTYTPVYATIGQTIMGGEGCEIILRSGSCVANVPGESGITNITQGIDMYDGQDIDYNNLLIVPRNDGRGVRITSNDAWLLIKGDHLIADR